MKRIVGHDSLPEEELWIRHFPDESFDDRATGAGFKRAEGSTRCLEDSKGKEHLARHADLFRDNTRGIARPYSIRQLLVPSCSIRMFQRSTMFPLQPSGFSSTPSAPSFVVV